MQQQLVRIPTNARGAEAVIDVDIRVDFQELKVIWSTTCMLCYGR